ncbi:MAG: YegP family protein [Bacteroidota bacterium]
MVEIREKQKGEYVFILKSNAETILLNSIVFKTREALERTVSSLPNLIQNANCFERKTNHNGKFLFLFKNKEGSIIGQSLLYNSEAGMENGIKNTKKSIDRL